MKQSPHLGLKTIPTLCWRLGFISFHAVITEGKITRLCIQATKEKALFLPNKFAVKIINFIKENKIKI